MKKLYTLILLFCLPRLVSGQELYNLTYPASTLPKGTLGIRAFDESYSEQGLFRKIAELKIMYGLTPKLTLILSGVASDYHSLDLPTDFILHNHSGKVAASANAPAAVPYPFIFCGTDLYGQYRFFSSDGQHEHFRIAAYGEASYIRIASHLAEAELLTHNNGVGGGLIATYLKSHFAATVTGGYVVPFEYQGNAYDQYGGPSFTTIKYSNAVDYDLALGYLLFPRHYKSYKQTNINLYCEFIGKSYGAPKITQKDGVVIDTIADNSPFLQANHYVEINPGIQCIIKSNLRIDVSVGFPLINYSFNHDYPLYYIAIQRYFYFIKKHNNNL